MRVIVLRVYERMFPRIPFRAWGVLRLEAELGTIVYRAGFAVTPMAAERMVQSGHVLRNGVVATMPSQKCKPG